jgi:hypothetical protein
VTDLETKQFVLIGLGKRQTPALVVLNLEVLLPD